MKFLYPDTRRLQAHIAGVALLATVAVGSCMPWDTSLLAQPGVTGDGAITLTAAIAAAALWTIGWPAAVAARGMLFVAVGCLIVLVTLIDMTSAFAAAGVYVTFAGGLGWLVLTLILTVDELDEEEVLDGC